MKYAIAPAIVFALFFPLAAAAITINTVPVDNPGNTGRVDGVGVFGAVSTSYRIATTEVTNAQYVEFLNAVAASDPNGLYNSFMTTATRGGIKRNGVSGSYTYTVKADAIGVLPNNTNYTYGDKPVAYVSWFDAARFANWVNNGASATSSTETGAYTMSTGATVARNPGAIWFLPTENQWYKAAYYDGTTDTYYNYATKSNLAPDNHLPADATANSADYFNGSFTVDTSYPYTPVGAYTQSKSPYGTFDQNGNVWEWTETPGSNSSLRIRRGGAFDTDASKLISSYREGYGAGLEIESVGFRLATIATTTPVGVPGDYNNNGVVDTADYILWRKFNGNASVTLPNDSTTGTSAADYTVWRSHFGQTSSGAGSGSLGQSSVPEPSAALLALIGLISLICFQRSRLFAAA